MGNDQPRMKYGKTLSDANIAELSSISGFTPAQVREWHAGFLVSSRAAFVARTPMSGSRACASRRSHITLAEIRLGGPLAASRC